MSKTTKIELGLLTSIIILSDGHKKTKDEISFEIANHGLDRQYFSHLDNLISEQKVFNNSILLQRHVTKDLKHSDIDPSDNIGKGLRSAEDTITDRSKGPMKRGEPGSRGYVWYLIEDHKTLYEIYLLTKQIKTREWQKKNIQNALFQSDFYQKMINMELVTKLKEVPEKVEWLDSEEDYLKDSELEIIFKLVKISPSALNAVLEMIYQEDVKVHLTHPFSEFALTAVIFSFLDDYRTGNFKSTCPIDFKIEFSMKEPLKPSEHTERRSQASIENGKIKYEIKTQIHNKDEWGNKID